MNNTQYAGLSRSYCRSRKSSRNSQPLRKPERSSYHITLAEAEPRNDSFLSEKTSPIGYDWRRTSNPHTSVSVIQFNQQSKELSSILYLRQPPPQASLPIDKPSSMQLTKLDKLYPHNDNLRGSHAADIRRAKQINELKHRIVNLPSHAAETNSRCITEVIQRIACGSGTVEPRIKRVMNFRLKLKRPEVMKELMKAKLLSFSLSPHKPHSDAHSPPSFYQTTSNLASPNPEIGRKRSSLHRRNTLRNHIEKPPEIHCTDPFEIQPWNIEL